MEVLANDSLRNFLSKIGKKFLEGSAVHSNMPCLQSAKQSKNEPKIQGPVTELKPHRALDFSIVDIVGGNAFF